MLRFFYFIVSLSLSIFLPACSQRSGTDELYQNAIQALDDESKPSWKTIEALERVYIDYPSDPRVQSALVRAQSHYDLQATHWMREASEPLTWTLGLSRDLLILFALLSSFLLAALFSSRLRIPGRIWLILPAVSSFAFFSSQILIRDKGLRIGIVQEAAQVYTGPAGAYTASFRLHPGEGLLILAQGNESLAVSQDKGSDQHGSWYKIRLLHPSQENETTGWIPTSSVWTPSPGT